MSETTQLEDKASEVLVNMIDITVKSMNDVVEFGKQQIPDVIHQLLMWKALESLVSVLFPLILMLFFFLWGSSFWKNVPKQESRDNDGRGPWIPNAYLGADNALYPRFWFRGYVSFVISAFFALVLVINFNIAWLQIWIAPKVYLIQYAAELIKG